MGGGSAGSTRTTQQVSQVDPWLSKTNELAYNQVKAGVDQTGGLPAYLNPNPYALPSTEETNLYGRVAGRANEPLMSDIERSGIDTLKSYSDPSASLATARNLFEQYAAPVISNNATVSGVGRSGAVPEALGSGFAQMALPIMEGARQSGSNYAAATQTLGNTLEGRANQRLLSAIQATEAPRLAQSAEYMRPLQTIANLVGGLPMGGGTVTGYMTGRTAATRGDFDVLGDLIIPLVGAVVGGAAGSGCWLTVEILGPEAAILARLYMGLEAPKALRKLYNRFGKRLAHAVNRSPILRKLLTPVVNYWVYRGRRIVAGV